MKINSVVVIVVAIVVGLLAFGACSAVGSGGVSSPGIEIDIDSPKKSKSCPFGKKYNSFTKRCESKSSRLGKR
ncbi:hypothetical protein SEA_SHAM_248 [Streptomyces phage Sham]|nr:hypothetical protein SEA_SHAM_248 [Streptomyces phage Sham]